MSDTLHISSVLVMVDPPRFTQVRDAIERFEFTTISAAEPPGKLIVTLETPTEVALVQGVTDMQMVPGVVTTALCHHLEKGCS